MARAKVNGGLNIFLKQESAHVQFAVGFKVQGKTGHVVVEAEDGMAASGTNTKCGCAPLMSVD
jgi:hypothetical protein